MDARKFYAGAVHETLKYRHAAASDFDDMMQEGVIAGWRASTRDVRDPYVYGGVAMRRRVGEIARGKAHTGRSGKKVYEPLRHPTMLAPDDAVPDTASPETHDGSDVVSVVRRVLDERAREIVWRKFWLDQDNATIARAVGMSRHSVKNIWQEKIKPTLRTELAHCHSVC